MKIISITKLRRYFLDFIKQVEEGEEFIVQRNKKLVARLMPINKLDWRNRMSSVPIINVSVDELIMPLDDVWKDYL